MNTPPRAASADAVDRIDAAPAWGEAATLQIQPRQGTGTTAATPSRRAQNSLPAPP